MCFQVNLRFESHWQRPVVALCSPRKFVSYLEAYEAEKHMVKVPVLGLQAEIIWSNESILDYFNTPRSSPLRSEQPRLNENGKRGLTQNLGLEVLVLDTSCTPALKPICLKLAYTLPATTGRAGHPDAALALQVQCRMLPLAAAASFLTSPTCLNKHKINHCRRATTCATAGV